MTNHQGVVETARLVRDKKTTASQMLDDCIDRIRSGDSETRAFMRIDEDSARLQAKTVDDAIAAGQDPGVPAILSVGLTCSQPRGARIKTGISARARVVMRDGEESKGSIPVVLRASLTLEAPALLLGGGGLGHRLCGM